MKKLYLILMFLPLFSYSQKLIDLNGDRVRLDRTKINYFVVVSQVNCHECYLEIEDYFEKSNIYADSNIVVNLIVFDEKDRIKNVLIRKSYYNFAREYFPKVSNLYYSSSIKNGQGVFLRQKFNLRNIPSIIIIDGKKVSSHNYTDIIN